MCYTGTTRICVYNFAAACHAVSEFINTDDSTTPKYLADI